MKKKSNIPIYKHHFKIRVVLKILNALCKTFILRFIYSKYIYFIDKLNIFLYTGERESPMQSITSYTPTKTLCLISYYVFDGCGLSHECSPIFITHFHKCRIRKEGWNPRSNLYSNRILEN